jgi:tetratricopeptide (TPR) repeat protein
MYSRRCVRDRFSRPGRRGFSHLGLVGLILIVWTASGRAQTGRVGGVVKDESGNAIKGATVTAENPNASPSSHTATTDEKGRFSIIGLRSGMWSFTAQAPGFAPQSGRAPVQTIGAPNPPLTFTLKKGPTGPSGVLAGINAKDLQTELAAADQAFNAKQWDDSIQKYQTILVKAPALNAIYLQIAQAHRNKADDLRRQDPKADLEPVYDQALAAYDAVLKSDPTNDKARIGIGMTNLEKGDLEGAEKSLQDASQLADASREVFYDLGEVEFARGRSDEAVKAYEKAARLDPSWGKPLFALGKVALNKGDKEGAIKYFEKAVAVDPSSTEAAMAKQVVEQLRR